MRPALRVGGTGRALARAGRVDGARAQVEPQAAQPRRQPCAAAHTPTRTRATLAGSAAGARDALPSCPEPQAGGLHVGQQSEQCAGVQRAGRSERDRSGHAHGQEGRRIAAHTARELVRRTRHHAATTMHARTHARAHTHTHTDTHAPTHHTQARTQRDARAGNGTRREHGQCGGLRLTGRPEAHPTRPARA